MTQFARQYETYASPRLQDMHGEEIQHVNRQSDVTLINAIVGDEFDGEMHGPDGVVRRRERFVEFRTAGGGGVNGIADYLDTDHFVINDVAYDVVDFSPAGTGWVTARCARSDVKRIAHPGHRIRRFS